jgi:branched-chain amino acid transport system ATP-binding protein
VTSALELSGVVAGYRGTRVLRNVDLVAPAGRVTALVGANGAGKTTLMRVAAGQLSPSAGTVMIDGRDVTRLRVEQRVRLGVCQIPEGRAIFRSLTVQENLQLFSSAAVDADRLDSVMTALPRLASRLGQTAGTMSGGEQQMLALARAYLTEPSYLLVDEVSMGLAPNLVAEIFEFLAEMARRGSALLIVEQYVQQALRLADVVYVLRNGEITFAGEPGGIDADALAREYIGGGRT